MMAELVKGKNFQAEVIEAETPVLVDFQATWCGPCRTMEPVMKQLAEEFKGRVKVVKLDIDEAPIAVTNYKIRGVPTFILFNSGAPVYKWVGATKKTFFTEKFDELLKELKD